MKIKFMITACALLACGAQQLAVAGGDRVNVRGMGMARTYIASSKGLDAVGINPANLALRDDDFTLSLAPLGVHAGSDFMTWGLYNDYFTGVETSAGRVGKYLEDADKQRILDAFRDGVGNISADISVRPVGMSFQIESIGGFALTMTDHIGMAAKIPSDYVRFALYGNTPGSTYDFSATSLKASWLREFALSFGGTIPHPDFMEWLSLGASVKIVHGFGYYEVQEFNTSLVTADNGMLTGHVGYQSRLVGADPTNPNSGFFLTPFGMNVYGYGTGFDLGLAGGISDFMTVGVSIVDLGKVNWEDKIEETVADTTLVVDDPRVVEDGSAIESALRGSKRVGAPFSTSLPTTFRVGAALQLDKVAEWIPGEMLLAVDFNKGLVDEPGTSLYSRVSAGVEWKLLSFLPIRSGISFGGTDRMNYAFGFGLNFGFFDLDVATENMELLWSPDDFSHASIAVGTRFRF
jgi:hypothetical protein